MSWTNPQSELGKMLAKAFLENTNCEIIASKTDKPITQVKPKPKPREITITYYVSDNGKIKVKKRTITIQGFSLPSKQLYKRKRIWLPKLNRKLYKRYFS